MNTSPEMTRVLKFAAAALAVLVAFLAVLTIGAVKGLSAPNPAADTITVSGTGMATSTPDIAQFSFSVSADAASVADAQNTINTKTAKIVADLKAQGIADKDIQTSDYSAYPKYLYRNNSQIADGYTASQSVQVKVRNISDAGAALQAAGQDGATNLSGLNFTLDDPQAPAKLARDKAIMDAKTNAQELAKSLGVSLGRVVSFDDGSSSTGGPIPVYAKADMVMSAGAVAPTLPTGENTVNANVSVTYEIK